MRELLKAACLAVGVVCLVSVSQAGILVPIQPVPGSTGTVIAGINDNNIITGWYTTPDTAIHGFVGTLDGNYTTFDYPNGETVPRAINNAGYITGLSETATDACPFYGCEFLRAPDGSISAITKSGAPLDGVPQGIIPHTKFVGQYTYFDQNNHLFYYGYYGRGTKYRAGLTLPFNTTRTRPRGYNRKGTVTGYFLDLDNGGNPGFVLKNGVATAVRYPDQNAFYTYLEALNDKGTITGYWGDQDGTVGQSFLYDPEKNAFSPISVPGATITSANAINNAGVVALTDFSSTYVAYIYCTKKSACPLTQNAIEITERWIPATTRSVICRNHCIGPLHISANKPDAAAVREALSQDAGGGIERGRWRRH